MASLFHEGRNELQTNIDKLHDLLPCLVEDSKTFVLQMQINGLLDDIQTHLDADDPRNLTIKLIRNGVKDIFDKNSDPSTFSNLQDLTNLLK